MTKMEWLDISHSNCDSALHMFFCFVSDICAVFATFAQCLGFFQLSQFNIPTLFFVCTYIFGTCIYVMIANSLT